MTEHPAESFWLDNQQVTALKTRLGDRLLAVSITSRDLDLTVGPDDLLELTQALRETILAGPHGLSDLCGVERDDTIEAIYRFFFPTQPLMVVVRVPLPKSKPAMPSLTDFYTGALWPERELAEMFGVQITGHPDLRHLLLPEDWEGFPLRKDYQYPLEHPYVAPDPLREDPAAALRPNMRAEEADTEAQG